jgi:hypothetical protein
MHQSQIDDRWLIEIYGQAVGMVVRDEAAFVFHAAIPEIWSLDRQAFESLSDAERAVKARLQSMNAARHAT